MQLNLLNLLVAGSNSSLKRLCCAELCDAAVIATQELLNTLAAYKGLRTGYEPN